MVVAEAAPRCVLGNKEFQEALQIQPRPFSSHVT